MLIAHNGAIFIYLRVWSIVVIGIRVLPQPSVRITNISTLSFLQLCLLGDGKCLTLFIMKRIVLLSFCVMALLGCEKESPKLSVTPTDITLYSEGTKQITTNATDATFTITDDFYASVEANGMVTANKVGQTNILVNSSYGSTTIPVTVMPQYVLYPDVDELIGKNLSEVITVMGSNYETSTSDDGDKNYMYMNPTSYCEMIGFTFSGNTCKSIAIFVPTKYTTQITKALIERYTVAGMQNDYYFFLNHDEDVTIALTVYSASYIGVAYMARTKSKGEGDFVIPTSRFFEFIK